VSAVLAHRGSAPLKPLCEALGASRATVSRRTRPPSPKVSRPPAVRALDSAEKQQVVDVLCSERFVDRSPAEVFHTLLDEGRYHCSERTMYRILAERDEVKERRDQLRHPKHKRPELVATGPNQVWSWDITKLRTTEKWSYFNLYVLLDIFSRYVVGWMIARQENAALAKQLVEDSVAKHGVEPGILVLHSDRGAPMTSKTLAQLLADLDITRSLSRPHVSNDNPFSESHFKTAKYHPSYPGRFAVLDEAIAWGRKFFPWYNDEHKHSGIAFLTPSDVFYGRADATLDHRHDVRRAAYQARPMRFPHGPPKRVELPAATYINPPRPPDVAPSSSAEPAARAGALGAASGDRQPPPGGSLPGTANPGRAPAEDLQ
jgi:putative transposase